MTEKPYELTPEMRITANPLPDLEGNPADKTRACDWTKQESYCPATASKLKAIAFTGLKTLGLAFASAALTATAIAYERGSIAPYDLAEKASEAAASFVKSLGFFAPDRKPEGP